MGFSHGGHQVEQRLVVQDASRSSSRIRIDGVITVRISSRQAFSAAEHVAAVVVVFQVIVVVTRLHFHAHLRHVSTYGAAADGHVANAAFVPRLDVADSLVSI